MKLQCLMHVPYESAANIGEWAMLRGHKLACTHLYQESTLPSAESFDMLAIMGGPMNIDEYDKYPWIADEKDLIRKAIDSEKKIIGVCLGAQLLADVLGGSVTANRHKEIGWHPVKLSHESTRSTYFSALPEEMTVFHWHGDTFSIPPHAIKLASSKVCENQAFQYGNHVLGLQFHMEYSQDSIEKMLTHCSDELIKSPHIQSPDQIRKGYDNINQNANCLYTLLDAFAE